MVTEFGEKGMEKAFVQLEEIEDPEKYLNVLAKYVQYVLPKNMDLNTGIEVKKGSKKIGFE